MTNPTLKTILKVFLFIFWALPVYAQPNAQLLIHNFSADIVADTKVMTDEEFIQSLSIWQKTQPRIQYYLHKPFKEPKKEISKYMTSGWQVRRNPPVPLKTPIDWAENPNSDRNWLFQKNAMYLIGPVIQEHMNSRDQKHLILAKNILLDWIDYNLIQNKKNPFKWYDMSTGLRAVILAYVIDEELRSQHIDTVALNVMIRALVIHAKTLADSKALARENHAYFQLVGLMAICKALPLLQDCKSYRDYASVEMEKLIIRQFTSEGIHREHAPGYHFFSLNSANKVLNTGWFNLSKESGNRLKIAKKNKAWFYHPNGDIAMIGDSDRGNGKAGQFKEIMQTTDPNPGYGREFTLSGYMMLRSPWDEAPADQHSYLIFWAGEERPGQRGEHSHSHSHKDNFTFEWSEQGIPVLVDSGKYSYEKNKWREFFLSTRAHNTIEIGRKNFANSIAVNDPRLRAFTPEIVNSNSSNPIQHIEAYTRHFGANVSHRRLLALNPGHWLVVVDILEGTKPHQMTQWFHFHEKWSVEQADGFLQAIHPEATLTMHSLAQKSIDVSLITGAVEPRIQGWISTKYLKRSPNTAIGMNLRGESVTFATLFLWGSETASPLEAKRVVVTDGEISVCWSQTGHADGFTYRSQELSRTDQCRNPNISLSE